MTDVVVLVATCWILTRHPEVPDEYVDDVAREISALANRRAVGEPVLDRISAEWDRMYPHGWGD